jgi:hypothetical protein
MPRLAMTAMAGTARIATACGGRSGSTSPAQIQRVAGLMLRYGQIRQPLNVKQIIEG